MGIKLLYGPYQPQVFDDVDAGAALPVAGRCSFSALLRDDVLPAVQSATAGGVTALYALYTVFSDYRKIYYICIYY